REVDVVRDGKGDEHRNQHPDDAEAVALPGRQRVREPLEGEDEEDARDEIEKSDLVGGQQLRHYFFGSFFLNISSMRSVTRKPPKVLMATSTTAAAPSMEPSPLPSAPAARMA